MTTIGRSALQVCATGLALAIVTTAAPQLRASPAGMPAGAQKKLTALGIPFIPNTGQWEATAAFAARAFAGTLLVTTDGKLVYELPAASLTESFVNTSGRPLPATPYGYRPAETRVSHFSGSDVSKHRQNINTYDRVNLGDVFPGVNVQLSAAQTAAGANVEKIFTVAPEHDPAQIRIKLDGANAISVGDQGELIAHTGNGSVAYTAPIAYQTLADGSQRDVAVSYALNADNQTYGFTLGAYDRALPLVIDPLLKSTYLGGTGDERATAIAVHPHSGEVYVTGYTASAGAFNGVGADTRSNFSAAPLPALYDVFVARLSADLMRVIHVAFLGGSGDDQAKAIAIHPATGDVYLAGFTDSLDWPRGNDGGAPAQAATGGDGDAFVSRLSADLTVLRRSTYYGNSNHQYASTMAIHAVSGEIYIAGGTRGPAPTDAGVAQPNYGSGSGNGFVSRFSADLGARLAATHLGGSGADGITSMAIHPQSGDVYVAGATSSLDFPGVTASSAQSSRNGFGDWFVARLNRNLTTNLGATYLGGPDGTEVAYAIVIHPVSGEIVVAGGTSVVNTGTPFPGLTGAPQSTSLSRENLVAIARLNRELTAVAQSTLLGGDGSETAYGLAIHPKSGEIWVTGTSTSTTFVTPPASDALQPTGNVGDMFAARYSADLKVRHGATFLGTAMSNVTTGLDFASAIAVHPGSGEVLLAGFSHAPGFPGTTASNPTSYSGREDAIVTLLSSDLTTPNRIPATMNYLAQSNVPAGSLRTSNEARMVITPAPPSTQPVYLSGPPSSQICVTNKAGCCLLADPVNMCAAVGGFATGWFTGPWDALSGDYIAVRHNAASPSGTNVTNVITGGVAFPFVTSTGNASFRCNLDANADNAVAATAEGLILLRAMLGLTGNAVVAGTGVAAWEPYRQQLNANCGTSFQ